MSKSLPSKLPNKSTPATKPVLSASQHQLVAIKNCVRYLKLTPA